MFCDFELCMCVCVCETERCETLSKISLPNIHRHTHKQFKIDIKSQMSQIDKSSLNFPHPTTKTKIFLKLSIFRGRRRHRFG